MIKHSLGQSTAVVVIFKALLMFKTADLRYWSPSLLVSTLDLLPMAILH